MWLLYAFNAFQSSVTANLSAYATSDFEQHSLLPVAYIVSSAISAAVYLPVAKVLDLWGRAEGFTVMTVVATIGLVLMASCHSIQTFAAAQVFCECPHITLSRLLEGLNLHSKKILLDSADLSTV